MPTWKGRAGGREVFRATQWWDQVDETGVRRRKRTMASISSTDSAYVDVIKSY
jgi:hypothetical protein